MAELHALILAGGAGTRFWPWSRRGRPKQFLPIGGGKSLLQNTIARLEGWIPPDRQWLLTREDLASATEAHLDVASSDRIVAEPEGRDTAPALLLGARTVAASDPDAILLVLPSDHHIADPVAFQETVEGARRALLEDDGLYTFGVKPLTPETGYGYIQRGEPAAGGAFRVRAFREKPDRSTAEEYLAAGDYFWNAGIFLWRAETFQRELARVAPEFAEGISALDALGSPADPGALAQAFGALPKTSIDYALLERSDRVRMVDARFPWDDVGSWEAIPRLRAADLDENGNLVPEESLSVDSARVVALAGSGRTVVLFGVEDLLVVDTEDALLVCPREKAQEVKRVVEELRRRGREDLL